MVHSTKLAHYDFTDLCLCISLQKEDSHAWNNMHMYGWTFVYVMVLHTYIVWLGIYWTKHVVTALRSHMKMAQTYCFNR